MFAKLGGGELSWLSIIYSQSNVTNSTFVHNIHGWRQSLFSAIFELIWKRSHFSLCLVSASLPPYLDLSTRLNWHGLWCWVLSSSHVEDRFNKDPLNVPIALQYSNIFYQLFEISHLFNWYMRALSEIRVIKVQVSRFPILPRVIVSQDRRIPFV